MKLGATRGKWTVSLSQMRQGTAGGFAPESRGTRRLPDPMGTGHHGPYRLELLPSYPGSTPGSRGRDSLNRRNLMAKTTRPRKRLSHVAVTGLKEIPANAAWVLAKALHPATEGASTLADHVSDAASSAAESTRSASERPATLCSGVRSWR